MAEKKTDRRIRRTTRLLLEGLTSLMMEKDVSQITVKELSDYADINRGTFYLHYKDVYDMLSHVEEELFEQFQQILDENMLENPNPNPKDTLVQILSFIKENITLTRALLGPHGDFAFISGLKNLVKDHIYFIWTKEQLKKDTFDYYCTFILYGFIGLIENWLNHNCDKSAEEMAIMSSEMIVSGMKAFSN